MGELPPRVTIRLDHMRAAELVNVLGDLVRGIDDVIGANLVSVLLVGSFAMGEGDAHSDVDFLAITRNALTDESEAALRELHGRLADDGRAWSSHLEGSYPTLAQVAAPPAARAGWTYVDNGSRELVLSDHDDSWSSRWVLRRYGIPLFGPDSATLLEEPHADALREEAVREAVRRRDALRLDAAIVQNAWGQTHVVTLLCRLLATAVTGEVMGKLPAIRWALERVGPEERWLLEQAEHDRSDPWVRVTLPADSALSRATPPFVDAMVERILTA